MPDNSLLPYRKADHIRINVEQNVQSGLQSGFDDYRFVHNALPEINLDEVSTEITIFGRILKAPLLISSMTGGTPEAAEINRMLAKIAQNHGLAMGLGSQRAAIEDPGLAYTFQMRSVAPDILLFANLGAVQLNYGFTIDHCVKAVEMAGADALFLHLNSLQEALQPEGESQFNGLLSRIEKVCKELPVPVVIKEVGWGISGEVARKLKDAGVQAIDVAGAGGTSWSQVESHRIKDETDRMIASDFYNWGLPTVVCLEEIKAQVPEILTFASGGIRNGIDIAKAIALGASLCGLAGPFLRAAKSSEKAVEKLITYLVKELRIAMFATGSKNLDELKNAPVIFQKAR
jgi:isopentenyl-diphosphate delta-isomerase